MKNKTVLVINEPLLFSWAKDAVTYGGILLMVLINHKYLDATPIIDAFGIVVVVGGLISHSFKSDAKKMTPDEAIEYLQEEKRKKASENVLSG